MKVQVIGDANTVMGFNLAGIPGHVVKSTAKAQEILEQLSQDEELALIIITKRLTAAEEIKELIEYISETTAISIVEIPDSREKISDKQDTIDRLIKRAVGFDIKY